MTEVEIRLAQDGDASAIAAVHSGAFADARGVREVPAEVLLIEWLREDGDILGDLSFVALDDEQIVGHVLSSRGQIGETPAVGLGPLGVLPPWQRRGVGGALMRAVIAGAAVAGEVAIALLGNPRFYERFGFEPAAGCGVAAPEPAWGEHFQLLRLTPSQLPVAGTFQYAPAFNRL